MDSIDLESVSNQPNGMMNVEEQHYDPSDQNLVLAQELSALSLQQNDNRKHNKRKRSILSEMPRSNNRNSQIDNQEYGGGTFRKRGDSCDRAPNT